MARLAYLRQGLTEAYGVSVVKWKTMDIFYNNNDNDNDNDNNNNNNNQ